MLIIMNDCSFIKKPYKKYLSQQQCLLWHGS
jgi:hypothetical protein